MNKKVLWPFALTTLALMLNGCGGGSSTINENPTNGSGGATANGSCSVTNSDCLQFSLDYPIAGINFTCSSAANLSFVTKASGNSVIGSCKAGDTASFYLQDTKATRKIELGSVKLDTVSKIQMTVPPRLKVMDMAIGLTGQTPTSLNQNDPTVRVAMALVKLFQSVGLERGDHVAGDLQPTQFTDEKKNTLNILVQNITATEWKNGAYANILKPWLDVSPVSDTQAFELVTQLAHLSLVGLYQSDYITLAEPNLISENFYGCNLTNLADCPKNSANTQHMFGNLFLLSDRRGYTFGYGLQWKGTSTITSQLAISAVLNVLTKSKPTQMVADSQTTWLDPIQTEIKSTQPFRLKTSSNTNEDLVIYQGKLLNDSLIAGCDSSYFGLTNTKTPNPQQYALWKQSVDNQNYNGSMDIYKVSPASYLSNQIFKTANNVKSGQTYIFPLYATLNFKFDTAGIAPIDLGIVVDENGDIRTDIKPNATATDMSGQCGVVSNTSLIDNNGVQQYRIGTTGGTESATNDKSITVRMIFGVPQLGNLNGIVVGLNSNVVQSTSQTGSQTLLVSGAKINVANLLQGQTSGANLTTYDNKTVSWLNPYAFYQQVYNNIKDISPAPTETEKALGQRMAGTVTLRTADCYQIKTKS
ncbi:protein FilF [Acinetobacter pittii]|uniref:putative pilus system protein FilF n=1 Tax=Acinetobacter pittii TaxID=48296 RepID=UPI002A5AB193|nr:protein FilF [Acinetobacter pittii]MDY0763691.1 protein FilF [Acinetobacter pittii]WPP65611.1 protein FilF [Acinetobacter pittii]